MTESVTTVCACVPPCSAQSGQKKWLSHHHDTSIYTYIYYTYLHSILFLFLSYMIHHSCVCTTMYVRTHPTQSTYITVCLVRTTIIIDDLLSLNKNYDRVTCETKERKIK